MALQAGKYRVIFGKLVIQGKQPDGDTLQFNPDDSLNVQYKGRADPIDKGLIGVRMEGVDAPETHYLQKPANEQPGARAARDELLTMAGFGTVTYNGDGFEVATVQNSNVRVAIIARGGDGTSSARLVGYVVPVADAKMTPAGGGAAVPLQDGAEIDDTILITQKLLEKSLNYRLLVKGLVYPSAYDTTPASHRQLFRTAAQTAMDIVPKIGVWKTDATSAFDSTKLTVGPGGAGAAATPIHPMLFRRWGDFQAARAVDFQDWIGVSPRPSVPSNVREVRLLFAKVGQVDQRVALSSLIAPNGTNQYKVKLPSNGTSLLDAIIITSPADRLELADVAELRKLARGEEPWMYQGGQYHLGDEIQKLLGDMAGCRHKDCPVPKKHPFYASEVPPQPTTGAAAIDLPFVRKTRPPVMPVVPIRTARGRLMFWGSFPTAKFTTRPLPPKPNASNELFVAIGDIAAPLESVPYFDGYKTRDVLTAEFFQRAYLEALGLDPMKDVWITNLVKCFLFKDNHVKAYEDLGWANGTTGFKVEATAYGDLMTAAGICGERFLKKEAQLCAPKLIVTFGGWDVAYMRELKPIKSEQQPSMVPLVGVRLRAGDTSLDGKDKRKDPWDKYNVMHMYHPEAVLRARDSGNRDLLARHEFGMRQLAAFIEELKETEGLVLG